MKVKHLLEEIEECKKKYPDFLEWDVYTEQLGVEPEDDMYKKFGNYYEKVTDSDDWVYVKTEDSGGFAWCTKMPKEKIFTLNVNF